MVIEVKCNGFLVLVDFLLPERISSTQQILLMEHIRPDYVTAVPEHLTFILKVLVLKRISLILWVKEKGQALSGSERDLHRGQSDTK